MLFYFLSFALILPTHVVIFLPISVPFVPWYYFSVPSEV